MLEFTLLTLGLFTQAANSPPPMMQFTNRTYETINVWVYCKDTRRWENHSRPLVIRAQATASIALRKGNFQVVARNVQRQEVRNNRILSTGELDWMDIYQPVQKSAPQQPRRNFKEPESPFIVGEHTP